MSKFIEGDSRFQTSFLPECIDDYISEDNPCRIIDAFVDRLDLQMLGFKVIPPKTGRPSYHPAMMLKLYIYGYLNQIQSSRRLERESERNIELLWLLGRLSPDFKTIADFRKNNTKSIVSVCREFVIVCRNLNLLTDHFVAIDGSKFKAVNNSDRNFTQNKLKKRIESIEKTIDKYLQQLENADIRQDGGLEKRVKKLNDRIETLYNEMDRLKLIEADLEARQETQISFTDPDSRSMTSSGKGTTTIGYNVQTAVDTHNHIIVAHEVNNLGSDRQMLKKMSMEAKKILKAEKLEVVADKGYYSGKEILECEENDVITYIPKCDTSNNHASGFFGRHDFIYIEEDDEYECPAGERLTFRNTREEAGKVIYTYYASECVECPLKPRCTTGKHRRVRRWESEYILDEVAARLESNPDLFKIRRQTVEHPFGTIKSWMGSTHFKMKTLDCVNAEMSLNVLAYNFKRVINIIGENKLREYFN